jgi:ribonuclease HII
LECHDIELPMKLPNKTIERKLFKQGYDYVVAVDEVGMGCLAGPVVVCAVLVDKKFISQNYKTLLGLKESKLLNKKQRENFSCELKKLNIKYKVCLAHPRSIDKLNIYGAARLAMKRATVSSFKHIVKSPNRTPPRIKVLVDGKTKIKGLNFEQTPIVKGDRKVFSIACASIIAKVFRDNMMERYAKKYPGYGFEKHMGYGTKYHAAQLIKLGPSKIHRQSFRLERDIK